MRAFRVDRIMGAPDLGPPSAFEPPVDFEPSSALRDDPLTFGESEPVTARVLIDAARAAWALDELGPETLLDRRPDGSVVVELSVVNRDAFRTFVLGLLEHAEVLEPAELRADIVNWLEALRTVSS
jgi:predicted DNA-binding transcriptional regulator YafY